MLSAPIHTSTTAAFWELDKAVNIMAKPNGKTLAPEDTENIVAFLKALSGNVPESARTMPELPVSHDVKSPT